MTKKSLVNKAISIKGKAYVLVSDRVLYFNETYPNGMIRTHLISKPEDEMVVVKAQIIPDLENKDRFFTGHSQAKWGEGMVNKTSALENAETSAVGRALAMMGIGVIDSIASADEMKKAEVGGSEVEGKECPKCGGKLVEKKKKDGGKFHKCSNAKWNAETNKNEGCNYVDWLQPEFDGKHPYSGKAIPVTEYEESQMTEEELKEMVEKV